MKRILAFAALASTPLACTLCLAQATQTAYLDPNSPFSVDFSAALQKRSVPVVVTTEPANARYNVTFQMLRNNGSIFQGITSAINNGTYDPGGWDRVSIQVVDNQTKNVSFSYNCKKYKNNSSDPMQSAAECLAKHWKSALQK